MVKIHIQGSMMTIGGNRYKAFVDYLEDGKERSIELVSRHGLRNLFKQLHEWFGDKIEEVYAAKITGEFEIELTGDDLVVWETPIKDILGS